MTRKRIDTFVEKLSITFETRINDYKAFIELQKECLDMLEEFYKNRKNSIDGIRNLSYFRLKVKHLIERLIIEKKRPMKTSFLKSCTALSIYWTP